MIYNNCINLNTFQYAKDIEIIDTIGDDDIDIYEGNEIICMSNIFYEINQHGFLIGMNVYKDTAQDTAHSYTYIRISVNNNNRYYTLNGNSVYFTSNKLAHSTIEITTLYNIDFSICSRFIETYIVIPLFARCC